MKVGWTDGIALPPDSFQSTIPEYAGMAPTGKMLVDPS
jgi:hypothetical protein